jgi:SOS-response transcriptional repressor LexA
MSTHKTIPILPAAEAETPEMTEAACNTGEPYVLMVHGDSMLPEFEDGDVIVIEPDGLVKDGSYVVAFHNGEYTFRQLRIQDGRYSLVALNALFPSEDVPGIEVIKGVVIQKSKPGKRKLSKSYI